MSDVNAASTEVVETTAQATSGSEQTEAQVGSQSTEVTQSSLENTNQNYDWVPQKFIRDGQPDFEKLAKSYVSMEKKLGQKGPIAPDSIEDYEYQFQSYEPNENLSAFKEEALKAGITKDQFTFLMNRYEQEVGSMLMTPEKAEAQLKQDWGSDFQANLSLAAKAFEEFAPLSLSMDDPALNHPSVLKLLAALGSQLGEDSASSTKASGSSGMTEEKINELRKSGDYWKPETQALVRQWYESKYK